MRNNEIILTDVLAINEKCLTKSGKSHVYNVLHKGKKSGVNENYFEIAGKLHARMMLHKGGTEGRLTKHTLQNPVSHPHIVCYEIRRDRNKEFSQNIKNMKVNGGRDNKLLSQKVNLHL